MKDDLPTELSENEKVAKQEFSKRLQEAIINKGWTVPELARQAGRFTQSGRLSKHNVYGYVKGESLPGAKNLNAICLALGIQPGELLPSRAGLSIKAEPKIDIRPTSNGKVLLRVEQLVTPEVAIKVAQLLAVSEPTSIRG